MWIQGATSYAHIGRTLECDKRTAKVLVDEETELRQIAYSHEIARSIGVEKTIQLEAWTRYHSIPEQGRVLLDVENTPRRLDGSLDMSAAVWVEVPAFNQYKVAYLKLVMAGQENIDKITGAAVEPKERDPVNVNVNINGGDAEPPSAAHERLLTEVERRRLELDEADRQSNPRITLGADSPDL